MVLTQSIRLRDSGIVHETLGPVLCPKNSPTYLHSHQVARGLRKGKSAQSCSKKKTELSRNCWYILPCLSKRRARMAHDIIRKQGDDHYSVLHCLRRLVTRISLLCALQSYLPIIVARRRTVYVVQIGVFGSWAFIFAVKLDFS